MIQLLCWYWLPHSLARKSALKLLVQPYIILAKTIVQEVVALQSIITIGIEINLYPRGCIYTIKVVNIYMPIKIIHREWKTIEIKSITHTHINIFIIIPLQQAFIIEKRRCILDPTLLLIVDNKKSIYTFGWMKNWLQIILSYEHWIWTSSHESLIFILTICVK